MEHSKVSQELVFPLYTHAVPHKNYKIPFQRFLLSRKVGNNFFFLLLPPYHAHTQHWQKKQKKKLLISQQTFLIEQRNSEWWIQKSQATWDPDLAPLASIVPPRCTWASCITCPDLYCCWMLFTLLYCQRQRESHTPIFTNIIFRKNVSKLIIF